VIDRDLYEEDIPVVLTDERREQVEDIAAQVVRAGQTGELPERVCAKPSDARGKMCPFAAQCFADWTPPDVLTLDGDVPAIATELYLARNQRDALKASLAAAESNVRAAQESLAAAGVQPGEQYELGGVRVRRTQVKGRETFSISKARKSGVWSPLDDERLAPFVKVGDPYDRWTVERIEGEDLVHQVPDDEDVPF
jgi:hypothetical protein